MYNEEILNKIVKLLKSNPNVGRVNIAKEFGLKDSEATKYLTIARYLLHNETKSAELDIAKEIYKANLREHRRDKRYEYMIDTLAKYVREFEPPKIKTPPKKVHKRSEEIAVILLSDLHIGEVVDPNKICGINEYNPEIVAVRLEYYAEKISELIDLQRSYTNINRAIVWLGGDIVSGEIHEELIRSNRLPALQQVALAGYLIAQFLAELSTIFDEVEVITTVGNHGRTSRRKQSKYHTIENLDYLSYQIAGFALRKIRNIKIYITQNIFQFVDINGWRFVFSHGDETRSWMGIPFYGLRRDYSAKQSLNIYVHSKGDLTTPVQPVNYKVVGHFHISGELPDNFGYTIMNGSMKGIDEYAFNNGWVVRPSQRIFGVHKEFGKTWSYDVWMDNHLVRKNYPERYSIDVPDLWADMDI